MKKGKNTFVVVCLIGLGCLFVFGIILFWSKTDEKNTELRLLHDATLEYAKTAKQNDTPELFLPEHFLRKNIQSNLVKNNSGNIVCTPANDYVLLAVLAEITSGDSRQQILDYISEEDMNWTTDAKRYIQTGYCNTGRGKIRSLSGSLWLDTNVDYKNTMLGQLATDYQISSFSGNLQSEQTGYLFRDWINKELGDDFTLEQEIRFHENSVLELITATYFSDVWKNSFSEKRTVTGEFYGKDTITCEFLKRDAEKILYQGTGFTAVAEEFANGGAMWFILPDSNVSVSELIQDEEVISFIAGDKKSWLNQKKVYVTEMIPKFNLRFSGDIKDFLIQNGIVDIFDMESANFTPIAKNATGLYFSELEQLVNISIDENGCATTSVAQAEMLERGVYEGEKVSFVVDRPFVFYITDNNGLEFADCILYSME